MNRHETAAQMTILFFRIFAGRTGSACFISQRKKMNPRIGVAASRIITGIDHPSVFAISRPARNTRSVAARRKAPAKSNGFFSRGMCSTFGITKSAPRIPMIPIGMLMKKIQCHERYSAIIPPSPGPNARAAPPSVASIPAAIPFFSSGR